MRIFRDGRMRARGLDQYLIRRLVDMGRGKIINLIFIIEVMDSMIWWLLICVDIDYEEY